MMMMTMTTWRRGELGWHDGNKLENVANLGLPKQA